MSIDKHETEQDKEQVPVKKFLRGSKGKPLTRNAGLFKLRGIFASGVPGGYSWRKHEIPSDCGDKSHPGE